MCSSGQKSAARSGGRRVKIRSHVVLTSELESSPISVLKIPLAGISALVRKKPFLGMICGGHQIQVCCGNMIILTWPSKALWPNRKAHWTVKSKAASSYKQNAYWAAFRTTPTKHLTITFHPPDKRTRDLDNLLAAIKHGIDGISEAWGVNDSEFEYTLRRGEPIRGGEVRIT